MDLPPKTLEVLMECAALPLCTAGLFLTARGMIDLYYSGTLYEKLRPTTRPGWASFLLLVGGLVMVFEAVKLWLVSNPGR